MNSVKKVMPCHVIPCDICEEEKKQEYCVDRVAPGVKGPQDEVSAMMLTCPQ